MPQVTLGQFGFDALSMYPECCEDKFMRAIGK